MNKLNMNFPKSLTGLRIIHCDSIIATTYTGQILPNLEDAILQNQATIGISSSNYDVALGLITDDIIDLGVSSLATESNLALFKIECGSSGSVIGITSQTLDSNCINRSINIATTFNSIGTTLTKLGVSGEAMDYHLYLHDDRLDDLEATAIDHETRIDTIESLIGTTLIDVYDRLDLIEDEQINAGVSIAGLDTELASIYDYFVGEIDELNESDDIITAALAAYDTAQSVINAAQTAYNIANEAWKTAQGLTNTSQTLTNDGVDDRLDDHDGQLEILTTFRDDCMGTTFPQFLCRNETIIPSSFASWTGNSTKTLNTNERCLIQSSGTNSLLSFDNSYTSIYGSIGMESGNMVMTNPENDFIFKDASANELVKVNQSGNCLFRNNLTISGTIQCQTTDLLGTSHSNLTDYVYNNVIGTTLYNIGVSINTNLNPKQYQLGVSVGVLDTYRTSMVGTSMPNYLTRNETLIPNSFQNWGTNATSKIINTNGDVGINGGGGSGGLLTFNNAYTGGYTSSFGMSSGNMLLNAHTGSFTIRQAGSDKWNMNSSGHITNYGNLTVSGTLQSPLTSLIGVSSGIMDGRIYNLSVSGSNTDLRAYNLSVSGSNTDLRAYNLSVSGSNTDLRTYNIGVSSSAVDLKCYNLGVSHTNLTSYVYSLNNSALGTSISNVDGRAYTLGISSGIMDGKLYNLSLTDAVLTAGLLTVETYHSAMLGSSMPNYLTRNETILPSSFVSSSLTSLGTLSSATISGNMTVSGYVSKINLNDNLAFGGGTNNNNYIQFISNGVPDNSFYVGKIGADLVLSTSGALIFKKLGTENSRIDTSGNWLMNNNLTVSGQFRVNDASGDGVWMYPFENDGHINATNRLRLYSNNGSIGAVISSGVMTAGTISCTGTFTSPLTTTLGTSISVIDLYKGTMLSTSMPQYLTRNETTLPSSFVSSSLTSLGTQTSLLATRCAIGKTHGGNATLEVKANQTNAGSLSLLPKTDNTENSIYFPASSSFSQFATGTTGSWVVGTNIAESNANAFSFWNPSTQSTVFRMAIDGHARFTNNLTVSGVLQSPLTSLQGVSIGILDTYRTSMVGTSMANYLTRNETLIPSSFIAWGTTSAEKTIHTNSYIQVNTHDTQNSYFKMGGSSAQTLFGQVDTNDAFIRLKNTSGQFKIQNSSAVNKLTVSTDGNTVISGTLSSGIGTFASDTKIYNSGGNAHFKIQSSAYTYRYTTDTSDNHYLYDGADAEVYHVDGNNDLWFTEDVNCAGTFYDSGIPLVASSGRLKKNIKSLKDIPDRKTILDSIDFKKYSKTYKNKTYGEVGIIIEDLEQIDGIEDYDFIHTRKECSDPEVSGLKYLKFVPFFMTLIAEMKERIIDLEARLNSH
jgi:hypothetical protein